MLFFNIRDSYGRVSCNEMHSGHLWPVLSGVTVKKPCGVMKRSIPLSLGDSWVSL